MTVVEHDITERMPTRLGGRTAPQQAAYRLSRDTFDVAIGDLPFILANHPEHPYERQSERIRKEQIDTQGLPGEQSLTGWWLRSQANFTGGQGITFYEPLLGEGSETRFLESRGVNVFDHDDVRLLNQQVAAFAGGNDLEFVGLGEDAALFRTGTTFRLISATTTGTVSPAGTAPKGIARIPGDSWLVGHSTGITRITRTGGMVTVNQPVVTGATSALTPFWAKDRIFATQNHKIFQLTLAGGAINETDDLLIAHPVTSWRWVGVAETGGAVWMAGKAAFASSVYVTTVDNSEATPTLTTPTVAIQLPAGEYVTAFGSYLDMLLVGTNRGFRVAVTDGDRAQLGPLLWDDQPVFSVGARGDFAYCGLAQGRVRRVALGIDTGAPLSFAYANDAEVPNGGNVTAIAFIGNKLGLAVSDVGATLESTELVTDGYIRTGFIRMGTLEPKVFQSVTVIADANDGTVSLGSAVAQGSYSSLTSLGSFDGSREVNLNLPGNQPWEKVSLEIRLQRGSPTEGPRLGGYQLRAEPAPQRKRELIQLPIELYDRERKGTGRGGDGYAYARFVELKRLEQQGTFVVFQDFRTGEAQLVSIESVNLINNTPPDRGNKNFGGLLTVVLRTV